MAQIEIALAANGPYFCGMLVTACSIARSARKDCRLSFNILDGGIDDGDYDFMVRRVRDYHADSVFNRMPVNDALFAGYPAWHGNKMAYARLILPSALKDKDWCIYCDVDFTWLRDIGELWDERLRPCRSGERVEDIVFIGTSDGNPDTLDREEKWFANKGFPFDRETYFCSGLCFFNLKAFREQKLIEQCAEILAANPDIQFPDQAALNIVTFGKRKIVPRTWQRFTYELTDEIVRSGCVVHHAGEIPWKPIRGALHLLSDGILLWHKLNAEICGITVWQSMRRNNSAMGIIYHRTLYHILRTPVLRQAIRGILCAAGKSGAWRMFECRSRMFGREFQRTTNYTNCTN